MDTVGEGENGTNGESRTTIYSCVRWMASEKLFCVRGSPVWGSVMTQRDVRRRGGREKVGDVCIIMADSCCTMAETNTTL